ncbi:4'-phosphopantetheinyl transferase family protein [Pseudomonas caricapapayae]|uniref:4'-phosphopantetheinyl transferase family protein n=1 Tax=Pseudomonas caricapapayae TaxID=46678 RepID=UPI000EFF6CCA|nr:4'-phosphopantetheinyl transferase superfamily protein [Pseudomonas caricapapayae]
MSAGASWAFDEDGQLAPPKPLLHDGVLLISCTITAGTGRNEARDRIRACVCKALSQWLGLLPGAITFISTPGTAPRLMIDGLPEPGFSISHEAGLSLAAVNLRGAVGVDVMRVQDVPDWHAVAQDYLGADVAAGLARVPGSTRPVAFARAWCEREACLKLHGVGLGEWGQVKCLEGVKVEVGLGEGLVGVMALHARG